MTSTATPCSAMGTTVFVTGLPLEAKELDIRTFFCSYGSILHIKMNRIRGEFNGSAAIRFREPVPDLRNGTTLDFFDFTLCVRVLAPPKVTVPSKPNCSAAPSPEKMGAGEAPATAPPPPPEAPPAALLPNETTDAAHAPESASVHAEGTALPETPAPFPVSLAPQEPPSAASQGECGDAQSPDMDSLYERLPSLPASFLESSSDEEIS